MSRIGKNPVAIPTGVTLELAGQMLTAKGQLGTLSLLVSSEVSATIADGMVTIAPKKTKSTTAHNQAESRKRGCSGWASVSSSLGTASWSGGAIR